MYGVPETFVIDKSGMIRYKQIGPVTAEALQQTILPLVRELQTLVSARAHALAGRVRSRWPGARAAAQRRSRSTRACKHLETELRCLVCQNQTLADSDAPLAVDLRREIRELAVAGRSDDEIRDFLRRRVTATSCSTSRRSSR